MKIKTTKLPKHTITTRVMDDGISQETIRNSWGSDLKPDKLRNKLEDLFKSAVPVTNEGNEVRWITRQVMEVVKPYLKSKYETS